MNNTTYTLQQLQSLSWQQLLKLGKATIIAILDEIDIWYDESENYFKIASCLYRYLKEQAADSNVVTKQTYTASNDASASDNEILTDVEFHNMSFRELQLYSIGKLNREPMPVPPKQPEPKPSRYRVLRTHYNATGYYYGMRVKRLLCKDLSTGIEEWLGSNDLDNINVGDIVQDSTGVGFVVPLKRTAKV